mgnify:CR=1 FL=1
MIDERFIRTAMLIGEDGVKKLNNSKVLIFGVGGVGGYVAEALARAGVGSFCVVDNDVVALSNINRQIIATSETVGRDKTEVIKERILSINPYAEVEARKCFFMPENADDFDFTSFDYVIDAVDTVTAKIKIIEKAKDENVRVISSMGTGNKLNPSLFKISDISKTTVCPLAKVMRRELKKRGINHVKVLYSTEEAATPEFQPDSVACEEVKAYNNAGESGARKKQTPASISFCPSVAGLLIAAEVIKDLLAK